MFIIDLLDLQGYSGCPYNDLVMYIRTAMIVYLMINMVLFH